MTRDEELALNFFHAAADSVAAISARKGAKRDLQIAADKFNAHLDVCARCRRKCFNPCRLGHKLLLAVQCAWAQSLKPG